MKINISIIASAILILSAAYSCGNSTTDIEQQLQRAEMAVAQGDMTAARSAAEHLIGDDNLSTLPASKLARLSMVYMQIADSMDQDSNVAIATDLYRRAYEANPDSAAMYYSQISPEHMQYATMLSTLVSNIDNPYDMSRDSINAMHDDSLIHSFEPSDSLPL